MTHDEVPSLAKIIVDLAASRGSAIPEELLERVVAEFAETQFDDDRNGTYQFLREIADEYALLQQKTSGGNR